MTTETETQCLNCGAVMAGAQTVCEACQQVGSDLRVTPVEPGHCERCKHLEGLHVGLSVRDAEGLRCGAWSHHGGYRQKPVQECQCRAFIENGKEKPRPAAFFRLTR